MPIIDVTNAYDELEVGSYIGIVTGKNYVVNEKQGTMKVSFKVSIDGKERRTVLYPVDGKGVFYVYQALLNMGADVPKRFELDEIPIEGLKAEFKVSNREFNGKTYKELEPVKPMGKASDEEMLRLTQGAPF